MTQSNELTKFGKPIENATPAQIPAELKRVSNQLAHIETQARAMKFRYDDLSAKRDRLIEALDHNTP